MSEIKEFTSGSLNPKHLADTLLYKIQFARENPDYFYPAGIWVFTGAQGSGKTLSAVQCLQKICKRYPKAIVCTNMEVKGIDNQIIEFTEYEQLQELSNGIEGVIFFLDEIHILWNSLESKEIPISEMACFCQMRKNRRVIIGTSQVYTRITKPIREQLQYIIECKNYFDVLQVNTLLDPTEATEVDGRVECKKIGTRIWFHSPELYKSYETLNKISRLERKEKDKERQVGKYVRNRNQYAR